MAHRSPEEWDRPLFCCTPEAFKRLVEKTVAKGPGVWTLIYYEDEYTPGNILKPDNKRKTHATYMSVKEFGAAALHHESVPVTCGFIRRVIVNELVGGMSAVVRHFLRAVLLGDGGFEIGGCFSDCNPPQIRTAVLCAMI